MQCPTCFLRYNINLRKPKVITCGHTICLACLIKSQKCRICNTYILQNKNYALNYSLMQIIQKDSKEIDKYVKVCFVGSSTTGKTSLIKRLMGNQFIQETVTTIGYDFSFQDRIVDKLQIRYQLWDSAGQEKYRAISPIHYKNANIVVIVYDLSQSATENKVSYWIEEALKNCPENVKIMIVGNKIDLVQENKVHRPIDEKAWNEITKEGYMHTQTSCKTKFGVQQFWNALDNELRQRLLYKTKSIINYQKQMQEFQRKKQQMTKIKKSALTNESRNNNSTSCC